MQPSRAIEETALLQSTHLFVFPLQDITAEDWKDVMEWLHLRYEKSGRMEYNAAAEHFLEAWDLARETDLDWAACRRKFQNVATSKWRVSQKACKNGGTARLGLKKKTTAERQGGGSPDLPLLLQPSEPAPPSPKKRKRTPSPERDATPEEEKKAEERTTDQVLKHLLKVWNGMAHPIPVKEEGVRWWMEGVDFTQFQLRRQKVYQPYGPWEHFPSSIWRD